MTLSTNDASAAAASRPPDTVTVTIDGFEIAVPKGTLVIRAAELLGIAIPRFCDHPLLDPVGACRQCFVEVEGQRKPMPSCTTTCTEGMVVRTQLTSPVAEKAQRGIMEFLLINHPLDCPMCDKGGECPLQNQAMANGQGETRFTEAKRTFAKPVPLSAQVLLDRERCVSCARCTRFSEQIAGDPFIELFERGPEQQIAVAEGHPFQSYFSGNTVQICPVGALTGTAYRFRSRPFDLVSTPGMCEHCASGCRTRTDHRRGRVMRRLAGEDPQVNEEWNCDKGRWAFTYATQPDRLAGPLVRDQEGVLVPASWPGAIAAAAAGLAQARGRAGVLTGGRLTLEDAYAYAKFTRIALDSNDIDMRARAHSAEETQFIAAAVAGHGIEVSYSDLENAPVVLLAGFEPEEESPIVFLRLRKAARKKGLRVFAVAPFTTPGLRKVSGELIPSPPGAEAAIIEDLLSGTNLDGAGRELAGLLGRPAGANGPGRASAVILAGERLAETPGALSAAARLAEATGSRLAWIPRRAGERGAVEAGALPGLLPVGRPVADQQARAEVARAWSVSALPEAPGRDTGQILAAAASGELGALAVAGVDPYDLPDPQAALGALDQVPFIVSIELRASAVTDRADVVFPVAAVSEKQGTFVNWEGRGGGFGQALSFSGTQPGAQSDLQVLNAIADEMDVHLGLPDAEAARRELATLGRWAGARPPSPNVPPAARTQPGPGEAVLATWHQLLDAGRMQDGEPFLAATARAASAMLSPAFAAELGVADGDKVTVATERGAITAPVELTAMPDRVIWLPANSQGCAVRRDLGVGAGALVTVRRAE
jgi:NADH-quinone oxidoreductase subunit G